MISYWLKTENQAKAKDRIHYSAKRVGIDGGSALLRAIEQTFRGIPSSLGLSITAAIAMVYRS